MTAPERAFLVKLAGMKQGRCGMTEEAHQKALDRFSGLLSEGYVRERRLVHAPGFQITAMGREYVGGAAE